MCRSVQDYLLGRRFARSNRRARPTSAYQHALMCASGREGLVKYPVGVIAPSRLVRRLGVLPRVGSWVGWGDCPEPTCEPRSPRSAKLPRTRPQVLSSRSACAWRLGGPDTRPVSIYGTDRMGILLSNALSMERGVQ